jgi:hypothetical protein
MPQFLLLKHYAGEGAPMTEWTPEEIKAHIAFQQALVKELADNGQLVRADGLAGPEVAKFVTFGGPGAAPRRLLLGRCRNAGRGLRHRRQCLVGSGAERRPDL